MKRFEYETEFVPRYYADSRRELESPENDTLKRRGDGGWLLCAVGSPDSVRTRIFYFAREVK